MGVSGTRISLYAAFPPPANIVFGNTSLEQPATGIDTNGFGPLSLVCSRQASQFADSCQCNVTSSISIVGFSSDREHGLSRYPGR